MQGKWIKPVLAVLAVPAVTIGAYQMVRAYEAGTTFQPSGSGRELQVNQVIFSGEEDTTAQKNGEEQNGESELWEKDRTAEDSLSPDLKNSADYLFQTGRADLSANGNAETVNLAGEEAGNNSFLPEEGNQANGNNSGYIYDVTGDADHADLVIAGGNGQNGGTSGANGSGSGSNSGQGGSGANNADRPGQEEPARTPSPMPQPTTRPADTVKDPEPEKSKPNGGGLFNDSDFSQNVINKWGDSDNIQVVIEPADKEMNLLGYLYMGQNISRKDVYCALNTYVSVNQFDRYSWTKDQLRNYNLTDENGNPVDNGYVDIKAVSFDGGNTWSTEFPQEIPVNTDGVAMKIKAAYRFSTEDTWNDYPDIEYSPAVSKVYLLNQKLTGDAETIDVNSIINYNDLYQDEQQKYNLYKEQNNLFRSNPDEWSRSAINTFSIEEYSPEFSIQKQQMCLFPGWTENGEPVDWFYGVTPGRHILEPMDMVPVPDGYQVELKVYYFSSDYQEDPAGDEYGYLQTLTSYSGTNADLLIPDGVQAIEIKEGPVAVDSLIIPDSTVLCKLDTDMLEVKKSCIVSKDNPVFKAQNGVLMDQNETEILEIPSQIHELKIPDTITSIRVSANNQLNRIEIQADTREQIPQIALSKIKNCDIVMKAELADLFLEEYSEQFEENKNGIIPSETPSLKYMVQNGTITDNRGSLRKVLKSEGDIIYLADDVTRIEEGAFQNEQGEEISATVLVMPDTETTVTLAEDCFKGSKVKKISCFTEIQAENVRKQLEKINRTDISVQIMKEAASGYWYTADEDGELTLVRVPEDITTFDGVKDTEGKVIAITAIGDNVFSKCKKLQWVILPESVKKIGYEAFRGCTSLQGILINAKDLIYIGDRAVEGCSSLRFMASNAMQAIRENDYMPEITDENDRSTTRDHFFYVLNGSTGYNGYATEFSGEDNIDSYVLKDLDAAGDCKMLYGATGDLAWLALRSGSRMPVNALLPETTTNVYKWAMAGTASSDGMYTVNWTQLKKLNTINECAFYKSGLGGKIIIETPGENCYIEEKAFAECENITEVYITGTVAGLGKAVFQGDVNLTRATLGRTLETTALYDNVFVGCRSLRDIYLRETPAQLAFSMYNPYSHDPFRFNVEDWSRTQEAELLRIHVPESAVSDYIKKWRYAMSGYLGSASVPAYEDMWETIQFANLNWDTWEFPDDEVVDALAKETLLTAENQLRKILGLSEVTEPTDFYPYHVENGYITLVGAPSNATEITLDAKTLELPEDWSLDYVGADAFGNSTNLKQVTFSENIAGIYSNAFRGVKSGKLTLVFTGDTPPELMGTGDTFTFGIDAEKICIKVPAGAEAAYYEAWKAYGVTIDGYTPPETEAGLSDGNAGIVTDAGTREDTMTVSGSDAISSVSDGDALPQTKKSDTPEEKDSTQEETVQ